MSILCLAYLNVIWESELENVATRREERRMVWMPVSDKVQKTNWMIPMFFTKQEII